MQLFPCPFCGERDETEFRYLGEAGRERPQGGRGVAEADWTAYLYWQKTEKGRLSEIWRHLPCGELFLMERDNVNHIVFAARSLRPEGA